MPAVHPHIFDLPTTINFDDVPDGTVIDSHYTAKGVTFASVTDQPPNQWSAYAREWQAAETKKNVISVNALGTDAFFDASIGGIVATFTSPKRYVSIDAAPFVTAEDIGQSFNYKPFIEGFDAQGNFIQGLVTYYGPSYGDNDWGKWKPLVLMSTSTNIAFVRFSSQFHSSPPHVYGLFDHFVFSDRLPINFLGRFRR